MENYYYSGIPLQDVLYHGTPDYFQRVNLSKGKQRKDFGKGFYLSYGKTHAREAALKGMRLRKVSLGYIYSYPVVIANFTKLIDLGRVLYFPEADISWLGFILKSRSVEFTWHSYDIVIGPTADDNIKYKLNLYRQGTYGNPESTQAKDLLISELNTSRYDTQLFIGNANGLSILDEKKKSIDRVRV